MFKYLQNSKGIALLSVVAVMAVLMIIGALLLKMASSESRMVNDYGNETRAFYVAEAGAALAVKEWSKFLGECTYQSDITEDNVRQQLESAASVSDVEKTIKNSYGNQPAVNISYRDFNLNRDKKEVTFKAVGEYNESYSDREITLSYDFFQYFNSGIADEIYELYYVEENNKKPLDSNEELSYNHNPGQDRGMVKGIKKDEFFYSSLYELKEALKNFFEPDHQAWEGNISLEISRLSEGENNIKQDYSMTLFGNEGRKVFIEGEMRIKTKNEYSFSLQGNHFYVVGIDPERTGD